MTKDTQFYFLEILALLDCMTEDKAIREALKKSLDSNQKGTY